MLNGLYYLCSIVAVWIVLLWALRFERGDAAPGGLLAMRKTQAPVPPPARPAAHTRWRHRQTVQKNS